MSFTGSTQDLERFLQGTPGCDASLGLVPARFVMGNERPDQEGIPLVRAQNNLGIPDPEPKNLAYCVPGNVVYVAKGASLELGAYDGIWNVAANVLGFDYLWNEVRVKGGAYGAGFVMQPGGFGRFHSFRDPGVDATIARFDGAASWLAEFDPDTEEMEGYVVSTVATHDAPVRPKDKARNQDLAYLNGRSVQHREALRQQKLEATPEKIRQLAGPLGRIAQEGCVCVFGSRALIEKSGLAFDQVVDLL